jgi:endonuclease/exonuclease/phosphatase family metal-dependent hydrolase
MWFILAWVLLVTVAFVVGCVFGESGGGDNGLPTTGLGGGLILLGLVILRFGRRRLLALLAFVCIVSGILSILYVPLLRHKSWMVWLQFSLVISVVGLLLLMKLWNRLTGLDHRLMSRSLPHRPEGPVDEEGRRPPVRVMSWNVFLRTTASQRFGDNDFKEERVLPIVSFFSGADADVVCLQEASSTLNYRVHRLLKAARRKGYRYWVRPASPPFVCRKLVDSGLLILSKLPLAEARTTALPTGFGDDALMHKAVQEVVVDGRLRVLNTHVQSEYSLDSRDSYSKIKERQYRRIGEVVRGGSRRRGSVGMKNTTAVAGMNTVLCGDLNCDAIGDETQCGRLLGSLDMDVDAAPTPRVPTISIRYDKETGKEIQTEFYVAPRRGGGKGGGGDDDTSVVVPRAMDYIMTRGNLSVSGARVMKPHPRDVLPVMLSDHRPVVADVKEV